MTIALNHSGTTVQLPSDLYWSDESRWYPVEQTAQRTITGALVISVVQAVGGRPITLEAIDDQSAWATRQGVEQLQAWAAIPALELTLSLRGADRTVIFRHHEAPAFEAVPIVHFSDVASDDFYRITLRLMEL